MPNCRCIVLAALLINGVAGSTAGAQSGPHPSAPHPSAAHEQLRFFEGTWTTSDSTAEDGFREVCAWMPESRYHMVCRSRWNTSSGPREGMSIFSFDRTSGKYLYNGFRPGGTVVVHRGEHQDGRWVFTSEQGRGEARVRTRVIIEPGADQGFHFLSESSTGEGPWRQGAKVIYRRIAP